MNETFWTQFYSKSAHKEDIKPPSSFAKFLIEDIIPAHENELKTKKLIDIGCGNGRDTMYFLSQGLDAYGLDSCAEVISDNQKEYFSKLPEEKKRFFPFNILSLLSDDTLNQHHFDIIYCRFFLHAINEEESNCLFEYFQNLTSGSMIALEFRTDKDPLYLNSKDKKDKIAKTDHYRRFLNFQSVCRLIEGLSYKIIYQIERNDLSNYINDNPVLGRIICLKN